VPMILSSARNKFIRATSQLNAGTNPWSRLFYFPLAGVNPNRLTNIYLA